jgi:Flp pilus assembly protein TadG
MKKRISERGQSLVELSISLLVLLYLLSGAVEFGLAFFQFVQLRDAAQEGALYGSMNPANEANIITRIRGASSSPINLADTSKVAIDIKIDGISITDAIANHTACEGKGLTVRVSYNHQIFMPFIPQLIGQSTIPLNATVTDTILTPLCPSP